MTDPLGGRLMPVFMFKIYRRVAKGATTGKLSQMKDVGADDLKDAEAKVSGHFKDFDFDQHFAILEDEGGSQVSYWLTGPRHA
jgi:hypothetical protein